MTIKIETDLITIIGIVVGIVGLSIAIYQTIITRKARKINESHCMSKCKNIVSLTRTMSNEVVHACSAIHDEINYLKSKKRNSQSNLTFIAERINGINVSTKRLVDFCIDINDEHESLFGYKVFPDINKELPDIECLKTAEKELIKSIINIRND